ncbi:hypothetical protein QBC38DRAFT_157159 [Podospora fimiseda]|uniref:Uncharacterized protein n=1 Tax=Podospora fimiseda TaxID=252190 RepID=A0AAN7BRU8_9PEZI|nr:hypothetical protein QBC38DRAFT_157159 [Podospora fimiseda]
MASKSSGVYARRPTDDDRDRDDRRARDRSRDRMHRRESFRRGDDYPDRSRQDDSPPSRRYTSDSPRDPSFRPEDRARANNVASTSLSTHDSEIKKPDPPVSMEKAKAMDLSKALKKWGDVIKSQAILKLHQEIMDKNLKQREKEYDKSTHQNAPHPSIAELQNKYRKTMDRDFKALEDALRKSESRENEAMSTCVKFFTGRLPAVVADSPEPNKELEAKLASFETMLQKQQETLDNTLKEQAEKEVELQKQIQEIQSQRDAKKVDFEKQIQKMQEQLKKDMLAMQEEFDRRLVRLQTNTAEEVAEQLKRHKELENRVGQVVETVDLQKRQNQSANDLIREELKGEFAKQVKNEIEDKLKKDLSTQSERLRGVEERLGEFKASSISMGSAEFSNLARGHLEFKDQTNTRLESQQNLQAELGHRLQVAESKLSQMDIEALDAATEMASFGFPDLKRKVENLEHLQVQSRQSGETIAEPRIKALETSLSSIQESLETAEKSIRDIFVTLDDDNNRLNDAEANIEMIHNQGMQALRTESETRLETVRAALEKEMSSSLGNFAERFGSMVNELRDASTHLGTRVTTLEARASTGQSPAPAHNQIGLKRTASAARLTSPDSASPATRIATERLAKDLASLAEKVDKIDGASRQHSERFSQLEALKIKQVLIKLQENFDMLKMMAESLDERFNNLTTKHLAEHLIGTLQQLCPNEAQLKADIDILKKLIKTLEGKVQEFTGKVEKVDDNMAKMMVDFKEGWNVSEDTLNKGNFKKRKLDTNSNGNGFARSSSNGLQ